MSLPACTKLFENFKISWDPELLTKDSTEISSNQRVYSDPAGMMHWQVFRPTDIAFGRNFFKNYSEECVEVVNGLKEIQSKLTPSDNELVELFRTHTIDPGGVNLIKTLPGKNINLHKDITRQCCLNIGLKNSNKWRSFISTQESLENFKEDETVSYILEDGEGYLLHINNPHGAVCLNTGDTNTARYILTYTYSRIS